MHALKHNAIHTAALRCFCSGDYVHFVPGTSQHYQLFSSAEISTGLSFTNVQTGFKEFNFVMGSTTCFQKFSQNCLFRLFLQNRCRHRKVDWLSNYNFLVGFLTFGRLMCLRHICMCLCVSDIFKVRTVLRSISCETILGYGWLHKRWTKSGDCLLVGWMKTFWILSYNASQWRPSEHLPNVHIQVKFEICLVFFWDVCFLDLSGFSKRRPQRLHLVSMSGMQRRGKNGAKNVAGTLSTFPPMQVCIAIQIFYPPCSGLGRATCPGHCGHVFPQKMCAGEMPFYA